MPSATVEERLADLEVKVTELNRKIATQAQEHVAPWWEQWVGAFKDNPDFEAAMKRGADYRRSQPTAAEDYDANSSV